MSAPGKIAAPRLQDIVGAARVIQDPAELSFYEAGGKIPSAAAKPSTKEEVAEVVKFAAAEGLAIVAAGARTKLGMGLPPRKYDLALDLSGLDRIIAYDPADLTLAVEPGLPLKKISSALAEHRQFLPLLVPYFHRATIGGTVASGVDSPLRQFYGTAREYVLGMEFVTGDGTLAKSGGRVVKNVSGYDLHKLMAGALGTLGVIVQINFKTFPAPVESRGFVASFNSADQAVEFRHRIAKSPLTPLTLDILSPRVAEMFLGAAAAQIESGAPPPSCLFPGQWTVATAFAGNEKVRERYANDLTHLAKESSGASIAVLDDATRPSVWGRLREFLQIALAESPATTIVKLSVPPTHLKDALAESQRAAEANSLPWATVARGLGIIYFAILPAERNADAEDRVTQAADQILAAGAKLSANISIPWCPSEWKSSLTVWGPERSDFLLMQNVKKAFDPHGVLSPGRFVRGL